MDIFSVLCSERLSEEQKVKEVNEIIREQGENVVNSMDYNNGKLPLHYAAEMGSLKLVHVLLSHGANLNVFDGSGRVPLHYAALSGKTLIVDVLAYKELEGNIEERVRTNLSLNISLSETGETSLHMACANGDIAMASSLKLLGASLGSKDFFGRTPYDCVPEEKKKDFEQFSLSNQEWNPLLSSDAYPFTTPVNAVQGVTVSPSGNDFNDYPNSRFAIGSHFSSKSNNDGRKVRKKQGKRF